MPDPSPQTDPRVLQLAPEDNVGVVTTSIKAEELLLIGGQRVRLGQDIPTGHKLAIRPIDAGEVVRKYGAPIGSALRAIALGEYVHTHNLKSDYLPTYTRDRTFLDGD